MICRRRTLAVLVLGLAGWVIAPTRAASPRFFPDDPIAIDSELQDASDARPRTPTAELALEFTQRLENRGNRRRQRAENVNTIDELPDSSWYTNRPRTTDISAETIAGDRFLPEFTEGPWTVIAGEGDRISPFLTVRDDAGNVRIVGFDSAANPEMTTGAEMVATRLFRALGYNTAETQLVYLHGEELAIGPTAPIKDEYGRRRLMTQTDLALLLAKAARGKDGRYRVIVRREPDGVNLGAFAYSGTRLDDPNDIFPHQHHRELRALRVFCAWLNHDDSRSIGTRDVLIDQGSRRIVRHYLLELGSMLGSGSAQSQRPRAGNDYAWDSRPKLRTMLTFGFYTRPWIRVTYPDLPSIGLYEATFFDPDKWKARYSNGAFEMARPDDLFWAARRVTAFNDADIRAMVRYAQYSDPVAEAYLAQTLIARRDKIGRLWLNVVLPLVDCHVSAGTLTCSNIAVDRKAAEPGGEYRIRWYRFDNDADRLESVGGESATDVPRFSVPSRVLGTAEFIAAEIRGTPPEHPGWATPMKVYFRRSDDGWQTVGVDRIPEQTASSRN